MANTYKITTKIIPMIFRSDVVMKKTFMSIFRCAVGLARRRLPQFFLRRSVSRSEGIPPVASRARRGRRFCSNSIPRIGERRHSFAEKHLRPNKLRCRRRALAAGHAEFPSHLERFQAGALRDSIAVSGLCH